MAEIEVVKTDVLCIGGGIAGLMAAIRARECGVQVTVAEKGNTLSSGAGGVGNDHFLCYIPEVHGPDMNPLIEELRRGQLSARLRDREFVRVWLENTHDIVKLWHGWGIPMKYRGRYEFAGHAFPGDSYPCHLKYEGKAQKAVLTNEAMKRGIKIVNRVMIFELLSSKGNVAGAIGAHTRDDRLIEFHCKAAVLGTGGVSRLYPTLTPAWMFNATRPGTLTGDGRAMAYRAGAELYNLEAIEHHAGPKYFARSGQATWVGVVRDPHGRPVGPYVSKPDRRYGDMIVEVNKALFSEYAESGRGPVYMDCRGISNEDYEYMIHWFNHEGFVPALDHFREEGIDLRKNPIEWATYGKRGSGGSILQTPKAETSLNGLYVAGDETTRSISPAATFGWIAGENAARYVRETDTFELADLKEVIEERAAFLHEIRNRANGPDWEEVNIALQQIMNDYAGSVRSGTMLEAGLQHLRRLRDKARKLMVAKNRHELLRCQEVLNLLDIGELVFVAALKRKETRGLHVRADYPYRDPLQDKPIIIKKVNGKPLAEWRQH